MKIEIAGKLKHDKASHKTNHFSKVVRPESLNVHCLTVIKGYLMGTDSNDWLIKAEKLAYKEIKK